MSKESKGYYNPWLFIFLLLWSLAKTILLKTMTLGCQSQVLESEKWSFLLSRATKCTMSHSMDSALETVVWEGVKAGRKAVFLIKRN